MLTPAGRNGRWLSAVGVPDRRLERQLAKSRFVIRRSRCNLHHKATFETRRGQDAELRIEVVPTCATGSLHPFCGYVVVLTDFELEPKSE